MEDWEKRQARLDMKRMKAAEKLTEEQREVLNIAFDAVRSCVRSLTHSFDLDMEDARKLEKAFWRMRCEFGPVLDDDESV